MTTKCSRDKIHKEYMIPKNQRCRTNSFWPSHGKASESCELLITAHRCRLGAQLQVTWISPISNKTTIPTFIIRRRLCDGGLIGRGVIVCRGKAESGSLSLDACQAQSYQHQSHRR